MLNCEIYLVKFLDLFPRNLQKKERFEFLHCGYENEILN